MDDLHTYYDVLEIPESASQAEVSKAKRRLALEYHPDRLEGLPEHLTKLRKDADEKWHEIQEAWQVLSDPAKRNQYDEALKKHRAQQSSPEPTPEYSQSGTSAPPPRPTAPPPPRTPPPAATSGSSSVAPPPISSSSTSKWMILIAIAIIFLLIVSGWEAREGHTTPP